MSRAQNDKRPVILSGDRQSQGSLQGFHARHRCLRKNFPTSQTASYPFEMSYAFSVFVV
jgi:hypothetical protein